MYNSILAVSTCFVFVLGEISFYMPKFFHFFDVDLKVEHDSSGLCDGMDPS